MTIQVPCRLTHVLTTRLSKHLFKHVKSQAKSSDYIRMLVERDMSLVGQDETI